MKPWTSKLIAAVAATLSLGAVNAPAALAGDTVLASQWRNPSNSVHIRIDPCGTALCGTVTWASEKAIADARRGGTTQLVGTRLFRNLQPTGGGSYKGKVFVPDIRKTFAGTLTFTDANTMVGKGCVLFGIVCKSQTWSRVS